MIFFARDIDFTFIRRVKVSYPFQSEEREFTLTKENQFKILVAGNNYDKNQPFVYDLQFQTANGNYIKKEIEATLAINFIYNPFTPGCAQFLPMGLTGKNPPVKEIQLDYYHEEKGPGWTLTGESRQVKLNLENAACTVNYPVVDPREAVVVYEGAIIRSDGRIKTIQKTNSNQGIIPLGIDVDWNSLEISAERVEWQTFKKVNVFLYTKDDKGAETNMGLLSFSANSGPRYWGYLNFGSPTDYYWRSAYYIEDYLDPCKTPEKEDYSQVLLLPQQPS